MARTGRSESSERAELALFKSLELDFVIIYSSFQKLQRSPLSSLQLSLVSCFRPRLFAALKHGLTSTNTTTTEHFDGLHIAYSSIKRRHRYRFLQ